MMYLIWSIINVAAFLIFLYSLLNLLFNSRKILDSKYRAVYVFLILIGVYQLGNAGHDEKQKNLVYYQNATQEETRGIINKKILLENTSGLDIKASLDYSVSDTEILPNSLFTNLNGLVSGFEWEMQSSNISALDNNQKGEYEITGLLKWNLFGVNLYTESKHFIGVVD